MNAVRFHGKTMKRLYLSQLETLLGEYSRNNNNRDEPL